MAGDSHHHRRLSAERVLDRLLAALPASQRPSTPPSTEVIRDGAALVVRRGPFLVRVRSGSESAWATARREVQLARLLEHLEVPVTALVEPADQPWTVDGDVVTAWSWSEPAAPSGPYDLGRLARTLRLRTASSAAAVAPFDPLAAVTDAVAGLPDDDPQVAFVRARAAMLADAYRSAVDDDPLGCAVVHGDLHRGNVVDSIDGPLLTDLELGGIGGASYGAAPAAVAVSRYGADPATLEDFLRGFDHDPRPWPGFATYLAVYELWVIAWAVGVRDRNQTWAAEARRRVETIRDNAPHTWQLR